MNKKEDLYMGKILQLVEEGYPISVWDFRDYYRFLKDHDYIQCEVFLQGVIKAFENNYKESD
jgi:hypothetical protein